MVDGRIEPSDIVFEHLDRCLVCRACETACPSGVNYHALIEAVRPQVAEAALGKGKHMRSGALEWLVGGILPHPSPGGGGDDAAENCTAIGAWRRGEKAGAAAAAGRDESAPHPKRVTQNFLFYACRRPAHRGGVTLLRGCVGERGVRGAHGINRACVDVLTRNGFDVHLLAAGGAEPCCVRLAAHTPTIPMRRRISRCKWWMRLDRQGGDFFITPIAGLRSAAQEPGQGAYRFPRIRRQGCGIVSRMQDVSMNS